ncbi:hypothetical protein KIM372_06320 [Bombiscardovia nodaiensis]|uniref:Uncharacterized protein n=1 Tax=Bombiscardovia nodaiensis TaxID=2932181 RepID=A0ABM8B786_9BIFI|nr:hypothetical protein KIM372_06320 [Bombiscardovia nodaiensis]
MAYRDFRTSTLDRLLELVKQVEPGDSMASRAADWIGDRGIALKRWAVGLNPGDSLASMDSYLKQTADVNNTSADEIRRIWQKVNDDNSQYSTRFLELWADLKDLHRQIDILESTINPAAGSFTAQHITAVVGSSIDSYLDYSNLLKQMVGKGLTSQDLTDLKNNNPMLLNKVLRNLSAVFIPLIPSLGVGQKWELPVGPGLVLSYEAGLSSPGNSVHVDLSAPLKEQRLQIEDMVSLSVNGPGVEVDKYGRPVDHNPLEPGDTKWELDWAASITGMESTWTRTHNGSKQKYEVAFKYRSPSASVGYGVETHVGTDTLSTDLKLTASVVPWVPLKVPEIHGPQRVPEFHFPHIEIPGLVPDPAWNPNQEPANPWLVFPWFEPVFQFAF